MPYRQILVLTAIIGLLIYWRQWIEQQRVAEAVAGRSAERAAAVARAAQPAPPADARVVETAHYRITTTATDAQTQRVAEAVEALYTAYADFFPGAVRRRDGEAKLKLTLYADRAQFKAHNRSSQWAEAYYLRPVSHAYYAEGDPSPHHWMLHEATHQLNAEVAGFPKTRWVDEGLGTYFGTSRLAKGRLRLGEIDPDTYPIWHLDRLGLSGDLDADLRDGRWIPIRALITGIDAPDIADHVNLYYVQYWSLTHFLFHGENGRYAEGYRRLIAEGGTLENFSKHIGPPDRIEFEWYRHLQAKVRTAQAARAD
jgi:hypothetical protein